MLQSSRIQKIVHWPIDWLHHRKKVAWISMKSVPLQELWKTKHARARNITHFLMPFYSFKRKIIPSKTIIFLWKICQTWSIIWWFRVAAIKSVFSGVEVPLPFLCHYPTMAALSWETWQKQVVCPAFPLLKNALYIVVRFISIIFFFSLKV